MLSSLWSSRKFRLMVFDFVVSAILYFGSKYLGASAMSDVRWFLLGAQPILISVVLGIAIEDNGINANPALVIPAEPVATVPTVTPVVTNPPASMVPPVG